MISVRELERGDLDSVEWSGSPTHVRNVGIALERADVDFLAICVDNEILGIGGVDYSRTPGAGTVWMVNVHPEHQSQGLGSSLMHALEHAALARGIHVTELNVETSNPRARHLYERLGYEVVGTAEETWQQEDINGAISTYHASCLHMRKFL